MGSQAEERQIMNKTKRILIVVTNAGEYENVGYRSLDR